MATMAARKGKLRLHQWLTLMLTLRLTPGTTMVDIGPTMVATMATDPMATMAMATGAARRGRLKLLLKLTPMLTPRLTPGTTMVTPTGPTTMAATTMATPTMAMATMDEQLKDLPCLNPPLTTHQFLWLFSLNIGCWVLNICSV